MMRLKLMRRSSITVLLVLIFTVLTSFFYIEKQLSNESPHVEIISPSANQHFKWNSLLQYQVKVMDKEDGLSEYEEINAKEVMMEVYYLPDVASAKRYITRKKNEKQAIGLAMIREANCFTCHKSKDKLIGPSFEAIAKRYKTKPGATSLLVNKVLKGGSGNWGSVPMLPHPDHSVTQVQQMVKWILSNGSNPDLAYYVGIDGAFRTKEKPAKKVIVLTASYLDHGDKTTRQNKQYGQHSILLQPGN